MNTIAISFVIYTLAIGALGIASARFAKQSHADFLLADRGLGPWVAGLSAAASAESGWVTLALVGMAFKTGVGAFWIVPGTFAAFLFVWFVLGPKLRKTSLDQDSLTIVDVIAAKYPKRFSLWIRLIGIGIVVSMLIAYVAAQLNSAGVTFSGSFEWKHSTGVLTGAAIVLIYTMVGGFRAVSWTDVVQSIFMIAAVTIVPIMMISEIGGFSEMWTRLGNMEGGENLTDPFSGKSGLALIGFFGLWLGIPLGNAGQPHSLIRIMSARDDKAVLRGGIICSVWVMVLFTGAVLLGIAARVYFGALESPEEALPIIATDSNLMPGIMGGILLAAIMAAICSTADSQLLVSASAVSHDLLERVLGRELTLKNRKTVERYSLLLVGVVATLFAVGEVKSVFTFVLDYGWAGLGAGLGPALIMTLLWKRVTGPGIIAGMLVGVGLAIVWKRVPALNGFCYSMAPAFFGSLLTIGLVSLRTQSSRDDADLTEAKNDSA